MKQHGEAINIKSSSPVRSPSKPTQMHPFFAPRQPAEKKESTSITPKPSKKLDRSLPLESPWPTVHCRPPPAVFSASPHPFPLRPLKPPTPTPSSYGLLHQLLHRPSTSPDFSRIPEPNPLRFVPLDRTFDGSSQEEKDTYLRSLPSEHVSHPAIRRLFAQEDEIRPAAVHQIWTEKYAPRRAEELLCNVPQTVYLREWLKALELRLDSPAQPSTATPGEENVPQPANRPLKRPRPVIQRAVEKKRKRRKIDDLEGWIAADDDDDEPEGYWSAEDDMVEEPGSPTARALTPEPVIRGTRSRPGRAKNNIVVSSPPDTTDTGTSTPPASGGEPTIPRTSSTKPYDFSDRLTNTILLSGPNGSGKTAAVYACTAELGWDVFEVYPGIRKRSGAAVRELVGDVGTNHIVGGASEGPGRGQADKREGFATLFGGPPKTHGDRQYNVGYVTSSPTKRRSLGEDEMEVDVPESGTHGPPTTTVRQSLILLEEVDILYQADSNFWPTVIHLIKNSRRPVIMTCNGACCSSVSSCLPIHRADARINLGWVDEVLTGFPLLRFNSCVPVRRRSCAGRGAPAARPSGV
jgi:hypothetical protein